MRFSYDASPHLWLDICGHPIDNAYVEIPDAAAHGSLPAGGLFFGRERDPAAYAREDPFATKKRLFLGEPEDMGGEDGNKLPDTVAHNLRIFR